MSDWSRRRLLEGLGIAGGIVGLSTPGVSVTPTDGTTPQTASSDTADWPRVSYDAANTRYNSTAVGPDASDRAPAIRWSVDLTPTRIGSLDVNAPVIVNDIIYVSHGGDVSAINRTSGQTDWTASLGDNSISAPIVVDGTLVVRIDSSPQRIVALNASDGTERWSFEIDSTTVAQPNVADGTVYVKSGLRPEVDMNAKSLFYALDLATGDVKWQQSRTYSYGTAGTSLVAPAVGPNVVVFPDTRYLYAFDATDGTERWSVSLADEQFSGGVYNDTEFDTPLVAGDRVVVSAGDLGWGTTVSLDLATGDVRWSRDHVLIDRADLYEYVDVRGQPAERDGELLFAGEALLSLDADDGDVRWTNYLGLGTSPVVTATDDRLYTSTSDRMTAYDATDGTKRWSVPVRHELHQSPLPVGGCAYAVDTSGYLYEVGSPPEHLRWRATLDGQVRRSPVADAESIYVATETAVVAVDRSSAEVRWRVETGATDAFVPSLVEGTIYAATEDRLRAIDAASGDVLWTFDPEFQFGAGPTIRDRTVYVGTGVVYALDAGTGDVLWESTGSRCPNISAIRDSPAVRDGMVYVPAERSVWAVDAESGDYEWSYTPPEVDRLERVPTAVATDEDGIYVGVGAREDGDGLPGLVALTPDGTEQWTASISFDDYDPKYYRSGPSVAGLKTVNGRVYAVADEPAHGNHLTAVDAADGTLDWRFTPSSDDAVTLPSVTDDALYVGSADWRAYALNPTDGGVIEQFEAMGPILGRPAIVDETMYVATQGGSVVTFDA